MYILQAVAIAISADSKVLITTSSILAISTETNETVSVAVAYLEFEVMT